MPRHALSGPPQFSRDWEWASPDNGTGYFIKFKCEEGYEGLITVPAFHLFWPFQESDTGNMLTVVFPKLRKTETWPVGMVPADGCIILGCVRNEFVGEIVPSRGSGDVTNLDA